MAQIGHITIRNAELPMQEQISAQERAILIHQEVLPRADKMRDNRELAKQRANKQ